MTIQKTPIIWQASWLLKNGTSILKMVWVLHQTSNRVTEIPQPKEIVCDKRQEMFFSNCDFIVYYRRRRRERFLYLLVTYPFPWCFPILGVPLLTKKKGWLKEHGCTCHSYVQVKLFCLPDSREKEPLDEQSTEHQQLLSSHGPAV